MKELHGVYRGVVEDNKDPDKLGQCRIRVFGVHTPHKDKINEGRSGVPTSELPWATPANPITEGSISGNGSFAVPLQGSHVLLIFEAGNPNQPIYFATIPGIPADAPDPSKGFNDPDGVYPNIIGESDVNRLARGVSEGTIVETKNDNRDTGVSKAGGGTWDEPVSTFAPEYPENVVIATHGGHVIELDNTTDAKRIHIYHSSGSYVEINDDGNMVIRNENDRYEVVIGNRNIHIKTDNNETVDGNKTAKVVGNETSEVGGALNITVTGVCNITGNVINLDGGTGAKSGVVTGNCICSFTGGPHPQSSSNVNSSL